MCFPPFSTDKPKPAKKAEHQEREPPFIKTDKPKPTPKETSEVTESGKKKTEKSEKESKGKDDILRYVHQISHKNKGRKICNYTNYMT
nr:triadin-like [Aotus nancymaae]XP_021522516.1 triadin-like [Aotus nancymaae]